MIFLNVPFREKDEAKSLGARWDAPSKRWYIPADYGKDVSAFSRWLEDGSAEGLQPELLSSDVVSNPLLVDANSKSNLLFTNHEEKGKRLSEVMFSVQNALRSALPGAIWVIAEIANINERRGHYYFELTETDESGKNIANCRAMIWQSQAERLLTKFSADTGSELAIGQKVLMLAEASFHAQYGFSLVIQDIDSSYTLGELEQKLNQIRKNLVSKGIYLNNKQHLLPKDFFRLAVIAPPEAAGLGDFRADADVLQNHQLCEFKYFYSSFQGEAVESEMLSAINAIESLHATKPYDAIVIIRGGGAKLDLSMLNIQSIAEKICLLEIPVMSGIGHERDNTIIDEVANTQFDTPSKVIAYIRTQIAQQAQTAMNDWQAIEKTSLIKVQTLANSIKQLNHDITQNSLANASKWYKKLEPLNSEVKARCTASLHKTSQYIDAYMQETQSTVRQQLARVDTQADQFYQAIHDNAKRALSTQKQQIIQSIAFVLSSGPKSQLNRGFSIVKSSQGQPITTAEKALNEKHINIEFADGIVDAVVSSKNVKSK